MLTENALFAPHKAFGPYFHKKEGRWIVMLRAPRGSGVKHTSISYARYKMSLKLGRKLNPEEEVDHLDDDKANDADDNLQLLSGQANREKYLTSARVTRKMARLRCPVCHTKFTKRWNQVSNKGARHMCCSRTCKGKLMSAVQSKRATLDSFPGWEDSVEVFYENSGPQV